MRTTIHAARGKPLALLLAVAVAAGVGLTAAAAHSISVQQTAVPTEVFVVGSGGIPDAFDLTMTLRGVGPAERYPVDCILVIDVSATVDPAGAKAFALDLIRSFGPDDRVGLVSYASTARLDVPLGQSRTQLRTAIGDLSTGQRSALGLAMQMARRELVQNGRDNAIWVEILISDGQNNVGPEPNVEGQIAADSGVMIVPVGIGTLINRALLEGFAKETGGIFFPRPTESVVAEIADHLKSETAASAIEIEKRLPDGLRLVSASPGPTRIEPQPDGTTIARWRIAELRLGQETQIRMALQATSKGSWTTDRGSVVRYADYRGIAQTLTISGLTIAAVEPNRPPRASFAYGPERPTTADGVQFTDTSIDSDGDVVEWRWEFGDGGTSQEQHPEHRYAKRGSFPVRLVVVDDRGAASPIYEMNLVIGNAPPIARFDLRNPETLEEITRPRAGVDVVLDGSGSYDLDGSVQTYLWDFDADGTVDRETSSPETVHTFKVPGEAKVSLTVVDDAGGRSSVQRTVNVLGTVTAIRTIETCLPDDRTIGQGVVRVRLSLTANTTINGLSVSETIPEGWVFAEEHNGGATTRVSGNTVEWLFLEKLLADGVNAKREIRYTLTAPAAPADGSIQASVRGVVGSSAPRFSLALGGEDKLTVVKYLTVPVVISRWDTAERRLDPCLKEQIAFDQIQYAVSLWLSGDPVPYTEERTIDLAVIQDLIAYWLTGSSVHDPLP